MELLNQFFGKQPWEFHIVGIIMAIIGALVVKRHFWLKHKAQLEGTDIIKQPWSLSKWWSENWRDVLQTVFISFLFVRFSDVLLDWSGIHEFKIGSLTIPKTGDTIFYYPFISGFYQAWIHPKTRK